jgi:hypothetical protein
MQRAPVCGIAQDAGWGEQRFRLKFSAHLTPYAEEAPICSARTTAARVLKDYNGQTYWLSFNPTALVRMEAQSGGPRGWTYPSVTAPKA